MPDLIRHPVYAWIPAFAGMTIGVVFNCRSNTIDFYLVQTNWLYFIGVIDMKISGGVREDGVIVGNAFDKYGSRNIIVRWLMRGFKNVLNEIVNMVSPESVYEVGCGEGYWIIQLRKNGIDAKGCDFSSRVIEIARANAANSSISSDVFQVRSIYDIEPGRASADLIICCEVLEHLEHPEIGLSALKRVATNYILLSVPREPLWCALNIVRGKYLTRFGNTPGHIQHWSKGNFVDLVGNYFEIVHVRTPIPWTMVLCRVKP
jgi:SAM-dependent methyltransferase